jgi:hypothetical protein
MVVTVAHLLIASPIFAHEIPGSTPVIATENPYDQPVGVELPINLACPAKMAE